MRYSKAFIPTLREPPADAEVVSHNLLTRAGMIRKVAMGIYDFLPLGLRSLYKIADVVRDEMNRAGAQEVLMPCVIPAELWRESGRWGKYGKELLRLKDRHEHEYCFGPTHEEVVCEMVRGQAKSYRDYPIHLYQIQTKFRDEVRPRFGLMRGREFLMKDGYSFHAGDADLDREYLALRGVYERIFARCGLASRAVEADTGAMGGSSSHEFIVLAETGEDAVAACSACDYAANLEKAGNANDYSSLPKGESAPLREIPTPGQRSIAEVSAFLKIEPRRMVKTLVCRADNRYVVVCSAGDREISEVKLKNALGAEAVRLASEAETREATGVEPGFLGPIALKADLEIIYDRSLQGLICGATGANKTDSHLAGVDVSRDIKPGAFRDVTNVREGDLCPSCREGSLNILRGIEVGHIFKLGRKYAEPMGLAYLDEHGKEQIVTMGCYGIGVSRVLAACVEQHHDAGGIAWPRAVAPFEVALLTMGPEGNLAEAAERLYTALVSAGVDVIWDDRGERAGVKFNDADLIGFPLQVLIGRKGLEKGEFEYKVRRTGERGAIPATDAVGGIIRLLRKLP